MLELALILIAGLALIVLGADWLVDGASSVARRAGISEFVIGLTIVGMGTSTPEMVVSFLGAMHGNADIAIGNVVGSNIFNTVVILGITALIFPMAITSDTRKKDIPVNIMASVLLVVLGLNHTLTGIGYDKLSRIDGAILLAFFLSYLAYSLAKGKEASGEAPAEGEKTYKTLTSLLLIVAGLAGLVFGGNLFVDSATDIAKMLGVSDKFIAVTILAGGTSAPELATCIAAAIKKKGQLALGNIVGSNIFNILFILGGAALITPLSFDGIDMIDLGVMLLCSLLILMSAYTGDRDKLDRFDAAIFLFVEAAYMTWLIIHL